MADERVKVTISFSGKEKRIPLVVKPGLELSDEQVDFAESDLFRIIRYVFSISSEARVYLHETESGRIMSKESFRDPANLPEFPRHWYLTTESCHSPAAFLDLDQMEEKPSHLDSSDYPDLLLPPNGHLSPNDTMDDTMEPLESLAEMCSTDMRYQSAAIRCDSQGQFGFTLRHFTIQPSNIPRSDTPDSSRPDSRGSMRSSDSLDTLKLSTTFVHHIQPGSPASEAGLKRGDVVHMINDIGIIRSGVEEVEELLQQCGDELVLLVLPKEHDDLQFLYPKYTNGKAGERLTVDGRVCTCDLPVTVATDENDILDCKKPLPPFENHLPEVPSTNESTTVDEEITASDDDIEGLRMNLKVPQTYPSPPHGLVPFSDAVGSAQSLDNSNSLSCSNDNDILITGSLSEIPVALDSPSKENEAEWGEEARQMSSQGLDQDSSSWQTPYSSSVIQNGNSSPRHGVDFPHTELHFISEDRDVEWYNLQDTENSFTEFSYQSLAQDYAKSEELQSSVSDTNFTRPKASAGHTRSQNSLERDLFLRKTPFIPHLGGKSALTCSTSALDRMGMSRSQEMSRSTDLGMIKLKGRGRKSLEMLTRIGSEDHVRKYTMPKPAQAIKRHKSDEHTHMVKLSESERDPWVERFREVVSSRGSDTSGSQQASVQVASQSTAEEQRTSGESNLKMETISTLTTHAIKTPHKSYKSQREQLHKRASSKTLPQDGELTSSGEHRANRPRRRLSNKDKEADGRVRKRSLRHEEQAEPLERPSKLMPNHTPHEISDHSRSTPDHNRVTSDHNRVTPDYSGMTPDHSGMTPDHNRVTPDYNGITSDRNRLTRDHKRVTSGHSTPVITATAASPEQNPGPISREHKRLHRERPASAIEYSPGGMSATLDHRSPYRQFEPPTSPVHKFAHSVEVPLSRKIPLYHTRSAHTPYGEQIVTEVPIDEAIRWRGFNHAHSLDSGVVVSDRGPQSCGEELEPAVVGKKKAKNWSIFGGKKLQQHRALAASDERLFPRRSPSPRSRHFSNDLIISSPLPPLTALCHGVLQKKQERDDFGKKSHDRSWRSYYALLTEEKIVFYKESKDAVLNKPCEEPPITVIASLADIAHGYTKRKYVFKIVTALGSEFLMQAEDNESLRRWVSEIQRLNGGVKPVELSAPQLKEIEGKLAAPSSPLPSRRISSPVPFKLGRKKEEGGGSRLFGRIKKTLKPRGRDAEEPDCSSFITFGQQLEDCPVSAENKRVPLVVEFCVNEVDTHGIDIEGIYRKGGQGSVVRALSVEMDKGNYNHTDYGEVHIISSLLKKFLKELPDPLIPGGMYDDFISCGLEKDEEQRMTRMKELVYSLPIAHYHTLKFLMTHLKNITAHSDVNKMNPRNVSLVFGPTLVRNPSQPDALLVNEINSSYTVVELLCRHVQYFFSSELCQEEHQLQDQLAALEEEDEKQRRQRTASEPSISINEIRQHQKEVALAKASPLTVRRIKNDLSGGVKPPESKRNSIVSDLPLQLRPKQHNQESPVHQPTTNKSSSHSVSPTMLSPTHRSPTMLSPTHRSPDTPSFAGHTPPHTRKVLVQSCNFPQEEPSSASSSTARTRHWVNHHWGKEEPGSMWAGKQKEMTKVQKEMTKVQKEKKDKRRISKMRQQLLISNPQPCEPVVHELLTSYQGGLSSPLDSPSRYQGGLSSLLDSPRSSTLPHSSSSPGTMHPARRGATLPQNTSVRRRVSYAAACDDSLIDAQVHDSRRHRPHRYTEQRESSDSRRFESTYHQGYSSHKHRGELGSMEDDAVSDLPVYSYLRRQNHEGARYNGGSLPDRGEKLLQGTSAYAAAQLESYL